jgi:hypothetical protein
MSGPAFSAACSASFFALSRKLIRFSHVAHRVLRRRYAVPIRSRAEVIDMRSFDPEATAPVRRFPADARPDRRSSPEPGRSPAATPAAGTPTSASSPAPARETEPPTAAATEPLQAEAARTAPAPARPEPVVLPDITTDEHDIGWGDLPEPGDDDRYLREVPPHHGS